jgi:hypothetical protein
MLTNRHDSADDGADLGMGGVDAVFALAEAGDLDRR